MKALRSVGSFFTFFVHSIPVQSHLLRDSGTAIFACSGPNAGCRRAERV